jgi:hypothetical protein
VLENGKEAGETNFFLGSTLEGAVFVLHVGFLSEAVLFLPV